MDFIDEQIQAEYNNYLEHVKERVRELFKQALRECVYDYYTPNSYERTYQMLNNVNVHINEEGELYVYTDNQFYTSAVDGSPQTPNFINYTIEHGHHDGKGTNQYHSYEGRHYLERAKELIDNEFKCNCEIISDTP
ncbi:hypothetical protein G8V07_15235 [Clostridium botulinum D/C]|uniref:hypothetical protein n=1 Tax=Clostridium botulinum TaxID=1491 RepID=UPI001E35AA3C|nr:hypothetical protein [Clostridium botulinum]MCD3321817.1 hypothetical protein [Clostridium botulinum D/C]MCD3325071.1 hypothetical protein [Clostridium botulinum D/C]MCD3327920.1 hypothetical protein [Clostridium botulinum D/C]